MCRETPMTQSRTCATDAGPASSTPMSQVFDQFPGPIGPLTRLYTKRLGAGEDYARPVERGMRVWVQASEGSIHVCGQLLQQGQGVLLDNETVLAAYAETDSLLLVADINSTMTGNNL